MPSSGCGLGKRNLLKKEQNAVSQSAWALTLANVLSRLLPALAAPVGLVRLKLFLRFLHLFAANPLSLGIRLGLGL